MPSQHFGISNPGGVSSTRDRYADDDDDDDADDDGDFLHFHFDHERQREPSTSCNALICTSLIHLKPGRYPGWRMWQLIGEKAILRAGIRAFNKYA